MMASTRVFKSGHSQAVRIPADLQYERTGIDYEIYREGDELHIRPAHRRLTGLADKFVAFSSDFMAGGREIEADRARDSL
jgi:antitoxin VapB